MWIHAFHKSQQADSWLHLQQEERHKQWWKYMSTNTWQTELSILPMCMQVAAGQPYSHLEQEYVFGKPMAAMKRFTSCSSLTASESTLANFSGGGFSGGDLFCLHCAKVFATTKIPNRFFEAGQTFAQHRQCKSPRKNPTLKSHKLGFKLDSANCLLIP